MRVVSVEQMRDLERLTFAAGTSEEDLQRRAGAAVADAVLGLQPPRRSVIALVGTGNNGRDAWIAAERLLGAGWQSALYLTPRHAMRDAEIAAFVGNGGRVLTAADALPRDALVGTGVVIDGLLGIGGRGAVRPPLLETAEAANGARAADGDLLVVAVDAPSGMDADSGAVEGVAIRADATVVLGGAKRGLLTPHALPYTGQLIFADIGVVDACPEAPELLTPDAVRGLLARPPADAHKGTFGRLLVVAGSDRYVGAAYLVCAAAIRTGSGIVTLAAPRWLRDVIAGRLPEITYLPLPDTGPAGAPNESAETILDELGAFSGVAIGPGLSTGGGVPGFVEAILRGRAGRTLPAVVDADGLNALALLDGWPGWIGDGVVMTPHVGELRRLAPDVETDVTPWDTVARLSTTWPATLVLKGPFTSIGGRGHAWVHALPNPGLATGGTGDVLTGIIGGLLARGVAPEAAAQLGVWVHGRAGALATRGRPAGGTVASDLIGHIPAALAETIGDSPRVEPSAIAG